MIPGIVAATKGVFGGGSLPNPIAGSLINLDFMSGNYWVGSTQTPIADILNEAATVGANGLDCSGGRYTFKGSALTASLGALYFTAVVEYSYIKLQTGYENLYVLEDSLGAASGGEIYQNDFNVWADDYDNDNGLSVQWAAESDTGYEVPTTSRVAATRTLNKWAISVNGHTVQTAEGTAGVLSTINTVAIGDAQGSASANGFYIRKFVLLDPQLDADLPTLSTIT